MAMKQQHAELGTLLFVLLALLVLLAFIRNPVALLVNSLVAIIILVLLNAIFSLRIPLNIITVLIVAIGGLIGLLLIFLLRYARIAFYTDYDGTRR